jgi:uncharacterized protein YutE (UPF0331/DUF86 family)
MNIYKIEWKISTLAVPILYNEKGELRSDTFEIDGIKFSPWENIYEKGYNINSWIASSMIEENNYVQAYSKFIEKLSNLIPKISLVSQCYIEYLTQSFIIHKLESELAFFREIREEKPVGLILNEKQVKALELLYKNNNIPSTFYYYWNDAINTLGYSGKLLLMFSAIEALANQLVRQSKQKREKKLKENFEKKILGKKLYKKCFEKTMGLRNRLVHGDYFQSDDFKQNYVEIINKKIINYFNKNIFKEILIEEEVNDPQRHILHGQIGKNEFFIRNKTNTKNFSLKEVLEEVEKSKFFLNSQKYEYIYLSKKEIEKY